MTTKLPIKKTPAAKAPAVKVPAIKKSVATQPLAAPKPAKPTKPAKPVKPKLVRDSFTIPKDEYQALVDLKARMTKLMQPAKKSELLRAGLKALTSMPDTVIKKALSAVPSIKTGRPAKASKK